jgi:eukaryotic-like serine/threonine-protein kinase
MTQGGPARDPRDPARYRRLLDLLGEALDQPAESRKKWLEALAGEDADFRADLARLLAHEDANTLRGQVDAGAAGIAQALADDADAGESHLAGDTVGRYRLERSLGAGGMGVVWLAQTIDDPSRPPVAIKLPATRGNARVAAERLEREGAILAALNHPNIARLIEVGTTEGGDPYLALEYVDGVPLPVYCDERKLPVEERLALFVKVLDAVAYAHATLVLHRDLKPANVFVNAGGEVKLLDFGIAKLLDQSGSANETALTRMAGRALTPDYASPEQIAGTPLTVASDVYSLGVMMFELLTGERPYRLKRGSAAELEEAILSADTSRPSTVVGEPFASRNGDTLSRMRRKLTGDLDTIVLKALKKAPGERYATVAALREDVKRFLDGRPVLATPDRFSYRARKFVIRNRLVVGAAASVFIALVAGLAVALWQANAAREQARVAREEFLVSIFEKGSRNQPDAAAARKMTVVDLLSSAGDSLRGRFTDQQRLKSELLTTTAGILWDLDRDEDALKLFREADKIAESEPGIPLERRVQILRGRSQIAASSGAVDEALAAHRRMHALLKPENKPTELMKLVVNAAVLGNGVGDSKETEAQLKEALRIAETGFRDRPEYFMVLNELGAHYSLFSDWPKTAHYYGRAVEAYPASGSKNFQSYAQAKAMRAYAMGFSGELRASIPVFEEAIRDLRERYGEGFVGTRVYEAMYAYAMGRHGRTADAARTFAKLAPPLSPGKSPDYGALMALVQEASIYVETGDARAALSALSRYPSQSETLSKLDSVSAMSHYINEAVAWEMQGDRARADALLDRIARINDGKSAEVIGTNPEYRLRATQIATWRGDYARAKALLAYQGGSFGASAKYPAAFDDEFVALNVAAADLLALSGDLPGAVSTIGQTRAFFDRHAKAADYPFLAAMLRATAARIAQRSGDAAACLVLTAEALELQRQYHAPAGFWIKQTSRDRANCAGTPGASQSS